MSDRELLEFAAKAAGIDAHVLEWGAFTQDGDGDYTEPWNPLTDDGESLRLAVKLRIDVKQYADHVVCWFDGGYIGTGRIFYEGDPCAATRRAIVRAAAEIGRQMP